METRTYESVKYSFSKDELRELGAKLAQECELYATLEADKAQTAAAFGAQLKAVLKRVADLTTRLNSGYELRDVECLTLMENPRPGLKTIVRIDDNSVVRTEAMTLQELQGSFGFGSQEGESS